jgi:multisubunit Na+/H+ antiporter MnhF subunit
MIRWIPRVLCILAIGFLLMFGLDAFDPRLSLRDQVVGFLIHSIPAFVLMAVLSVAWKRELVGGVAFALLGIGLSPFIYTHNYRINHSVWMSLFVVLMINVPFIITGVLFIIGHYMKKRLAVT